MNTNYKTDNRWSPGSSGADIPSETPAAYSARWIDRGDHVLADVLPDRQGFAYNNRGDMEYLIAKLGAEGDAFRTPHKIGLDKYDTTTVVVNTPSWKAYMRRAGGYIYVDAWLVPAVSETETDDELPTETVTFGNTTFVVMEHGDRRWRVLCEDGERRHEDDYILLISAQTFADCGHVCTAKHTIVEVWS